MDGERHIEKLLRAFAKKRKADAGAPLEMHPATRRLLQDEIARRAKTSTRKDASFWQRLFATPQRAFVVCALASVLITGTVVLITWNKPGPPMALAKNKSMEETPNFGPVEQPAPVMAPPTPAAMPALAEQKAKGVDRTATFAMVATNASGPMVAMDEVTAKSDLPVAATGQAERQAAASPAATLFSSEFKNPAANSGSLEVNREATNGLSTSTVLSGKGDLIADSSITSSGSTSMTLNYLADGTSGSRKLETDRADGQLAMQRFYRVPTEEALKDNGKTRDLGLADKKQVAGNVLDSFTVSQNGNNITVVDSDGSKYTGSIEPVALSGVSSMMRSRVGGFGGGGGGVSGTVRTARQAFASAPAGAVTAVPPTTNAPVQNYYFRVTGTNVSLNEAVVFSGNLVTLTNDFGRMEMLMTNSMSGVPALQTAPQYLWQNSRIDGKAMVGTKPGVVIEAEPVGK